MDAGGGPLEGDVHASGGDIDSLLSSDADVAKTRRLAEPSEPYERHRAHDLRAECYRRGIRPVKKGPNANDNKSGYILLLRKSDESGAANGSNDPSDKDGGDDDASTAAASDSDGRPSSNLPNRSLQDNGAPNGPDVQSFYEGMQQQQNLVLPMQYAAPPPPPPILPKPTTNNPTTDLEILSGIANSYTQNVAAEGQLCGNCRTVVTDQLMESIRLGKTKMKLQEYHKLSDQRDRDTLHLKEVLTILADLRRSYREAQQTGLNHELLIELQDDLAFFRALKEQTKQRMRHAMQEARDRSDKSNLAA